MYHEKFAIRKSTIHVLTVNPFLPSRVFFTFFFGDPVEFGEKPRDGPGQVTCRMTVDGQHGTESVVTFLATAKCASSASTGTQLVWITD